MNRILTTTRLIGMLGLLWGSVPLVSLGTFAQSHSPAFRSAEARAMQEIFWQAQEPDRRAGIGLMWGPAHHWLSVGAFCAILALVYTLGMQAVRAVCRRSSEVGQPLAVLFAFLCLVGTGFWLYLGLFGPAYQPRLLTAGYFVAALGLVFGMVAGVSGPTG